MKSINLFVLGTLLAAHSAFAQDLRQPDGTRLRQFGFSTGHEPRTTQEFIEIYDVAKAAVPIGTVVRTGLAWNPANTSTPGFTNWNETVLKPAIARNIIVIPSIKTLGNVGGYSYPTDAQWTNGLKAIVRMYGPGGTFQRSYPAFKGLTGFELWNEPNSQGNMNGYMTPARIAHLLKVGSAAIRAEARAMGFDANVIGPAIGEINLDYVKALKAADPAVFSYLDTITFHDYMKANPVTCKAGDNRCVKTYDLIRQYLDSNGGAHLHMGTTEGGFAGSTDACRPPNVGTEQQQADYSEAVINYIRSKPNLKFDFRITYKVIDTNAQYSYACGSKKYDTDYWIGHLGVVRPNKSLKAWGDRLRYLVLNVFN